MEKPSQFVTNAAKIFVQFIKIFEAFVPRNSLQSLGCKITFNSSYNLFILFVVEETFGPCSSYVVLKYTTLGISFFSYFSR